MELEPQTNNDKYKYSVGLKFGDIVDDSSILSRNEKTQSDSESSDTSEGLRCQNASSFNDDVCSLMTAQESRDIDQTNMKKIISLTKKLKESKSSTEEEIIASIEISPEGYAKITYPSDYSSEDIISIVKITNSTARESGENLSYDEDYTKDKRDDGTTIFSMVLNASICEKNSLIEVLYCPEPSELFLNENVENNSARKNFQKRMSNHIFESVEKIQQNKNKPEFILVPYKIGIYSDRLLQSHELLLVFDMNNKDYVKYFDSSHFTQNYSR